MALFTGSLLLCTLGCGPRERGVWRSHGPEQKAPPDLEILRCEASKSCQYRWQSFSGKSWALDRNSAPAARWLLADGSWSPRPEKGSLLEICWAPSGHTPCLQPRAQSAQPRSIPRWLLLTSPVETRGRGGMGSRRVRHTWFRQPPEVRKAILSGDFDAVVSLGPHGSELISDLERATTRSARQWLPRQIFALVLGFHHPKIQADISIASRSHHPEFWSTRKDLKVELRGLAAKEAQLQLSFVRSKKRASFKLPRLAPGLHPLRPRSQVSPCLGCGPRRDAILDQE